jgi:hypothetical protein
VKTAIETNAKYNSIRDEQRAYKKGRVTLLPSSERQPSLPPLEEKSRFSNPQDAADKTPVIDTRQLKDEQPPEPVVPKAVVPPPVTDHPTVTTSPTNEPPP